MSTRHISRTVALCVIGVCGAVSCGANDVDPETRTTEGRSESLVEESATDSTTASQGTTAGGALGAEVAGGEGARAGDQRVHTFCGLALQSLDLIAQSYGAASQEPFDRAQAALFAEMVAIAPPEVAESVAMMHASYVEVIGVLDGTTTLSEGEIQGFWQTHLDLSSEVQTVLVSYIPSNCDPESLEIAAADDQARTESGVSEVGEADEPAESAAAVTQPPQATVAPPPATSAPTTTAPASGGVSSTPPPPPATATPADMPLAGGSDFPSGAPRLAATISHRIPHGRVVLASTRWEATDLRPAVTLFLYMDVSSNAIVVGAGCHEDAADYDRRHLIVLDVGQTHQAPPGPLSFERPCGWDGQYFSSGSAQPYFVNDLGWWQHQANLSATYVERSTGRSETLTASVRFADYWR